MSWDTDFYANYANHLTEPVVRKTHDRMFRLLHRLCDGEKRVVDYGCGTGEFDFYDRNHEAYFGIDQNKVSDSLPHFVCDFMSGEIVLPFQPTVFISVFASEIIMPPESKYAFYRNVFNKYPTINIGMVAGAFYKGKENEETVREESGFTIFQTIEQPHKWICPQFTEVRCYCDVPSAMWGNVVEVWKFLIRKNS